jgi:preprotein translocase subunit SecA
MLKFLSALGDSNERALKKLIPILEKVNALEDEACSHSDDQFKAKTEEFKTRLGQGESLDDILPEAFAYVREASRRTVGMRHFDVQILGGIVLHQGKIAEMKTGEGKTLVATLPLYLDAITGKGAHLVTVNDYLAKRDTVWMGPIYHLMGLSVGCLQHETSYMYDPSAQNTKPGLEKLRPVSRAEAYRADITYGTNNEFGFDYLRDNMAIEASQVVQRGYNYAIVDEVDNILIDEARTPLIISGPAEEPVQYYSTCAALARRLQADVDYTVDEKERSVSLTPVGVTKVENSLRISNLYAPENYHLVQYVENALRAYVLYKRDRDYVVRDGEVVIVDEFTGRMQPGRRWADGLHQAVEAKEGVRIQRESITYATITLQNYFRLYKKLAGMTGTAATEAEEFFKIYGLDVVVIPPNKPMVRKDLTDSIYKSEEAKFKAIAKDIKELYDSKRPVLVGTTSIEKSELLSVLLKRVGVPHQVLNAKYHEKEAAIIAQAGRPGAVTVATNMAGRGTDIVLGGSPSSLDVPKEEWQRDHDLVVSLGGLHVIGTEHHEARRIDNQLRGRAARQGDSGSTRYYASLEDDIMRRFGGDRIKGLMELAGLGEDVPIESRIVTGALQQSQVRVESFHFDIRKHLLEYDDVLSTHREVIYKERRKLLEGEDLKASILDMVRKVMQLRTQAHLESRNSEEWDIESLIGEMKQIFPLPGDLAGKDQLQKMGRNDIITAMVKAAEDAYERQEQVLGSPVMRQIERLVMFRTIDLHWVQHLTAMENLRQGIGLQAVGQRDPLVMYKTEGHRMFKGLLERIENDVVRTIYHVRPVVAPAATSQVAPASAHTGSPLQKVKAPEKSPMAAVVGGRRGQATAIDPKFAKVGRNDPCPCGSGKKFKKCHGANL